MTLAPFPTTDFTGTISSEPALNEFEALCFTVDVDYCGTYEVCIPSYDRNCCYRIEKGMEVSLTCKVRPDQTRLLIEEITVLPEPPDPTVSVTVHRDRW